MKNAARHLASLKHWRAPPQARSPRRSIVFSQREGITDGHEYVVLKTQNLIDPPVGSVLDADEVEQLIAEGVGVTIKQGDTSETAALLEMWRKTQEK